MKVGRVYNKHVYVWKPIAGKRDKYRCQCKLCRTWFDAYGKFIEQGVTTSCKKCVRLNNDLAHTDKSDWMGP